MGEIGSIRLGLTYAPLAKAMVNAAMNNEGFALKLAGVCFPLSNLLIAAQDDFPEHKQWLSLGEAIAASHDENATKWLQGSLNRTTRADDPLPVDGDYGPKTQTAFHAVLRDIGIDSNGWAGRMIRDGVEGLLEKFSST